MKRPDKEVNYRSAVLRRDVLLGTAASLLTAGRASTQVESYSTQPEVGTNILPAAPIPATPSLGKGKARALVLGGGGEYFIAWLLGFAHGLHSAGVSYDKADVIVGTSAGAIVGSAAAAGHTGLLRDEIDFLGVFPKLLSDLIPAHESNSSQVARAQPRRRCPRRQHSNDPVDRPRRHGGAQSVGSQYPAYDRRPQPRTLLAEPSVSHDHDRLLHRRTTCPVAMEQYSYLACSLRERLVARRVRADLDWRSAMHGRCHVLNQHPLRPRCRCQARLGGCAHRQSSTLLQHSERY